jgi:hypothetical protein
VLRPSLASSSSRRIRLILARAPLEAASGCPHLAVTKLRYAVSSFVDDRLLVHAHAIVFRMMLSVHRQTRRRISLDSSPWRDVDLNLASERAGATEGTRNLTPLTKYRSARPTPRPPSSPADLSSVFISHCVRSPYRPMRSFHSPSSSAQRAWGGSAGRRGARDEWTARRVAMCTASLVARQRCALCAAWSPRAPASRAHCGYSLRLRCRHKEAARVMIDDHAHAQDCEDMHRTGQDRSLHRKLPGSLKTHRTHTIALILCFALFISLMVIKGALPAEHRSKLIIDTPA